MKLVVDANILIAALLKEATTRELLLNDTALKQQPAVRVLTTTELIGLLK